MSGRREVIPIFPMEQYGCVVSSAQTAIACIANRSTVNSYWNESATSKLIGRLVAKGRRAGKITDQGGVHMLAMAPTLSEVATVDVFYQIVA
ncbi:hypothetical protein HY310_01995 [Candidatus Microgenomates bacterium]|nr:hypothetical protein [Candidatus Microgenomates bacterium]